MPQTHASHEPYEDETPEPAAPAKVETTDALDSLLDEIDDSLQTNAEQFVRSFVQKGGQ
jgi:ubiquitin-like protein Pup